MTEVLYAELPTVMVLVMMMMMMMMIVTIYALYHPCSLCSLREQLHTVFSMLEKIVLVFLFHCGGKVL
jgi:hypothetical protein